MSKLKTLLKWIKTAFIYRMNKNDNRNNQLWAFGCWGGMKYSDNSKYLFEYVIKNHPNIRAVWITKSENIYRQLKQDNKEVYLANTSLANNILKEAGVAFFTNSLNDFGDNPPLNGAEICALFHGVGFKNELRELDNPNSLKAKLKLIKHKIYDPSYTSLIFTTSEFFRQKFHIQQYNAPLEHIILTGQPRNDILFTQVENDINKTEKLILYMPTFREDEAGQIQLESIINEMVNSERLQEILERYKYKLIIKPHYLTEVKQSKNLSNILVYNDLDIPDIQEVLKDIDILITDYSSVIGDFVLLNRPIIFFSYDLEEYKTLKPIHSAYDEVLEDTYVTNLNELIDLLKALFEENIDYERVNKKINDYINDFNLRLGGYSKNVCNYMLNYLKINYEKNRELY